MVCGFIILGAASLEQSEQENVQRKIQIDITLYRLYRGSDESEFSSRPSVFPQCIRGIKGDCWDALDKSVEHICDDKWFLRDIRKARPYTCHPLFFRWLLDNSTFLIRVRVKSYDMQAIVWKTLAMIFPYSGHSLALVRLAVCAMLHFVTFYQQPTPWPLYEEIDPSKLASAECRSLHCKFTCESDLQRS